MKTLDPDLESHLAGGRTQLCTALIITLRDKTTKEGYTDFQRPLIVDGVKCSTVSVYTGKAVSARADLSVGNSDVTMLLAAGGVDERQVLAGRYAGARYTLYLVKYTEPVRWDKLSSGFLGKTAPNRSIVTVELRDLAQALQGGIGEELSPTCKTDLGTVRCGVSLATHTVTGTIDSIDAQRIAFTDASRTEAANHFSYGKLTFTTGAANAGQSMEVKSSTSGGKIVLTSPLAFNFAINDPYSVYRGCNRLATTCKNVFNNLNRMPAELFVIGADELARFGRQ